MISEIVKLLEFKPPFRRITGIHGTLAACELDRKRVKGRIRYGLLLDVRNAFARRCFNRRIRQREADQVQYMTIRTPEGIGKRKIRRREQFRRAICQKIICDDNHYQSLVPRKVLR